MHRRILSILLAVAMLCTSLTPLYAQSNPLVIELPEGDVTYEQLQAMEEIAGLYGFAEADISFDSDELISVIVMFNNKPAPVEKAIAAGEGFIVPQSAMLSLETKASNDKVIFKAGLDEIFGNKQPVSPFVPIAPAGGTLEPQPAPYYLTFEYDVAINATAMLVPANKIPDLLDISSVAAVFYDAPHYAEDYNTEEIDIEEIMAAAVGNGSANNKVSLMGYEAPLAHAQGITGKGVTVGVVDSGVTYTHPDLKDAFFWFDTLEEVAAHNPKWVSRVHQVNGKYVYYGANVFDQMYYPYTNAPHPWPEIRRTPGNNYPGIALTNPTATTSANAVVWNHPDNTRGAWDPFETTAAERARMVSGGYGHNAMGYHGTHVSGIILARGNGTPFSSGLSTVGVAPEANLIGYKIGTPSGDGSDAAVIKALELGIDDGVKVFNYSYGFSYYPYTVSPLGLALNYAIYTYDIVFCKSAGNDGASSRTMGGPMAALAFIIGSGTYTALNGDFKVGDATFRGSFIYTNLATDFVPVLDGAQNVHAWILKGPNATANDDLSYDFFLMPPSGTAASAGLGSGIAADFNALTPQQREDIKGKIVVIGRPTTGAETITTTITRVATYGAAALVVVDPTSGTAVTKTWSASSSAQNNASYVPTFAFTNAVGTNFVNALRAAETPNGLLYSMNANGLYGISSFSSRGPIDDSYLIAPDILTPGTSIWSTYPYHSAASGYSNISGTSMSSPFAAGLSALVLSKDLIDNGEYTMKAHEVKARLTNTADRTILTGNYGINEIGPGAPHISKAVNATSFATCDEQVAILALKEIVEDRAFEYVTGERTSFSFRATYVGAQAHERTLTGNLYNKADYEKSYSLSFVRNTASNSSTQNVRNSTKFVPTFPETVITVPAGTNKEPAKTSFEVVLPVPAGLVAGDVGSHEGYILLTNVEYPDEVLRLPWAIYVESAQPAWYTAGEATGEYIISNITALRQLSNIVRGAGGGNADVTTGSGPGFQDQFEGKTVKLGANITIQLNQWRYAIGTPEFPFKGTFDGNGYTITFTRSGTAIVDDFYRGVFGHVQDATLKNITIAGGTLACFERSAAVVGMVSVTAGGSALIENCVNRATVNGYYERGGTSNNDLVDGAFVGTQIGGIVGLANVADGGLLTIKDCTNYGAITGTSEVGGILGSTLHGMAYHMETLTGQVILDNCVNNGAVTHYLPWGYSGGIVGALAAGEDQTSVLINCLNTGAVTGAVARTGAVYQITSDLNDLHSGVGGIAGYVQNAELTDNVNRGNVVNNNRIFLGEYEAVLYSGGIAALAVDSQVDNNVNLANVTSSSASDAFQVAAGVVGISQGATISDNLNMGNVTSPHVTAGAVAYGFGTEPNYVYHLAMQNGVLNKDLDHEDCLLITSAKLLLDYPIVEELIPASSWSTVLFIDPNSDEILYTQVLLNGDCIDETLLWNNVTFRSFVAWLDEDGEEYDDFTKPIYADCLVLKALVINHSYTTTKDFVSMVETAKNSRIWVLTFKTTNVYSDGAIEVINCSIELNGNNANLDGKYKFGAGHYLAGYTLVYDIKGNGSNIKNLSLIFE